MPQLGLGLTAMRDSEVAAESQGTDVPDAAFGAKWSAHVIFIVVIGGIGTIEGPIVGTLVFLLLRELVAAYGTWNIIVIGLVAVVTMIACPQGLWGHMARRFDLHFFPVQRRAHVAGD